MFFLRVEMFLRKYFRIDISNLAVSDRVELEISGKSSFQFLIKFYDHTI